MNYIFSITRKAYPYILCLLLFVPQILFAQSPIIVKDGFQKIELKNHLKFYVDTSGIQSFDYVQKHFEGINIQNEYPNFGDSPYPHWLRFRLRNTSHSPQKISIITKGIDSLQVYFTEGGTIKNTPRENGSHTPIFKREVTSPLLVTPFTLEPFVDYTVWVRIRNVHYRLAASPFDIYQYEAGNKYIFNKHFLYGLYIGSMFIILLFSLVLVSFFKQKIYWYYLGCVSCALPIMLIYNDFTYLITNHLPNLIINKNIFGILSATVPVMYLLFAEQFLEISPQIVPRLQKFSRISFIIQYLLIAVILFSGKALFEFKAPFCLIMSTLSTITLIYLYINRRLPHAKLFLFATLPVTFTVMLESFSNLHQIPVQDIHDYYYLTTLTELLLLTWGIVYRFKNEQIEKFQLQNEILSTEFTVKNEVSSRIAEKLHNDVSADLIASKSQLAVLAEEAGEYTQPLDWQYVNERLDSAYNTIRDLSHQLEKSTTNQSILALLSSKYSGNPNIDLYFEGIDNQPIETDKEVILFSVVSEAITNALKHAKCTTISVQVIYNKPNLKVIVEDDGIGFDTDSVTEKGYGLKAIKKKVVNNLRGNISIDSGKRGTVIIIKTTLNS
jgi:signal transduction histidine kinase